MSAPTHVSPFDTPSTRSGQVGYASASTAQAAQSTASSPVADAITEIECTTNRLIRAVDELATRLAPVSLTTVKRDNEVPVSDGVHSPLFNALDSLNNRLRYVELELTRVRDSLEI
ncbi:hypothetical protein FDH89_gp66 [Pseudomonas phage phiR18]|uniref:Uncharacterized protein n=1 Tax=Pseudomonas phage phiR18 TaxID=1752027 RepID=A0A0S3UFZ2_9CAUD|nr:hypothetical protein FDH89_gp66 [Pseudomonas phage phiR18]BAU16394.1 hypothetical protein [Pseudomonas phage phiR18]